MSKEQVMSAILELPVSEQEEIQRALTERLSVLTDDEFAELERRHQKFLANPASGRTLEQLDALIQQRRARPA